MNILTVTSPYTEAPIQQLLIKKPQWRLKNMFTTLLKNMLESNAKIFFKKYESEILDIIVFGSVIKGKEKPQDIDIMILYKNNIKYSISQEFQHIIIKKTSIPVEIISKTYALLFSKDFIAKEGILNGGYSLINKVMIAQGLSYQQMFFFVYKLLTKTKSERMRFYYSLYGRNGQGMLEKLNATKFTDTMILCPTTSYEQMKEYLATWKIEYKEVPCLLPQRLTSKTKN